MTIRRRLFVVVIAALGAVMLTASPAFAHAVLLQTSPTSGQVLTKAPSTIRLRFNENVEASLGAVRLYDEGGNRLDTSAPAKPSPDSIEVRIRSHLRAGAYVATWRVISADSHPVQGAFAFQVGTAANATGPQVQGLKTTLLGKQGGSSTVGGAYGVARWLLFASLALLIGPVVFLLAVWPAGLGVRRVRRLVWIGWTGTLVATVASFLLEGPYGAALSLGHALDPSVMHDTLDTRFGRLTVARVLVLLAAFVLVRVLFSEHAAPRVGRVTLPSWWLPAAVVAGTGVLVTVSVAGHAASGEVAWASLIADPIHVAAMAVWLGGLVVLFTTLLPHRDVDDLRDAVPQFSRLALACMLALVATGAFQTWRQVGSFDALRDTDYGQILIVKLALVVVLLVVAARSRQIAHRLFSWQKPAVAPRVPVVTGGADDARPRHEPSEDDDAWLDEEYELRALRHGLAFEAVLAVGILIATSLLVNAQPARSAIKQANFGGGASGVTLESDKIWVDVTVSPGTAGANDVHVDTLSAEGALMNPLDLTMTFDKPDRKIAPIDVPLRHLGPAHYLSPGFQLPIAGEWRVTARARLTDIDEVTLVGTLTIR